MRPATAISADGSMNLLEGVVLAADKKTEGRGVMVVLKGIIVAGSGNRNVSSNMEKAIKQLSDKGVPIVMATRTGSGYVSSKSFAIGAGFLNPQKSRILLQLALASDADIKQISNYFDSQR